MEDAAGSTVHVMRSQAPFRTASGSGWVSSVARL